jgi:hypothetical protein
MKFKYLNKSSDSLQQLDKQGGVAMHLVFVIDTGPAMASRAQADGKAFTMLDLAKTAVDCLLKVRSCSSSSLEASNSNALAVQASVLLKHAF